MPAGVWYGSAMTELTLHLNDPSSRVIRFDMETLPDELGMQVFQWLNSDYSDAGSDVMSFSPMYGGNVILHRSQVLFATVGRVRFNGKAESATPAAPVVPVAASLTGDAPIVRDHDPIPVSEPKRKGLWAQWVDTGKMVR